MSPTPSRTLVLLAHPRLPASRINAALLDAARGIGDVTIHDLYHAYPDGFIDVAAEQQRLLAHDTVVLQFPIQWYAMPALLKHWFDEVLQSGWAYGRDGNALAGKGLFVAATSGGDPAGYGRHAAQFTLTELFRPIEASARYCGMRWLGHVAYGASERINARLPEFAADYASRIAALTRGDHHPEHDSR
ncbi:NAD(P)H-dependent oxidoreductase [Silanimonas sp.]|jgi:glutathione-regulated potassium-efflux system ancillary protein KefG|uniref:NAD(P)H-dependent oxidoreductase n=1 Tax=Silanimonas sp. TaxID=1929290 RepID=UPI0022BC3999|nr:NAD(P)H-dependent oxidoreductase [Silanimonas sp.]MCZ8116012.1 NAD(P)H-dependent oxidoreductase [Silanimonas sp.]